MKLTKRKGFNFFRSYYDVYNELSDKDKVAFMDALLDRQFLGVKPEGLQGMAKFAYISQTNSIDSQVKGYEDKTGIKLNTPCLGGSVGGANTPSLQVQVEEKVEEKVQQQQVGKVDAVINELRNSSIWLNDVHRRLYQISKKVKSEHLPDMLDKFSEHVKAQGEDNLNLKEAKKHFYNWSSKRLKEIV